MCFLDLLFCIFMLVFLSQVRPLKSNQNGFGRDTTASLRGIAMIGIILHHINYKIGTGSLILSYMGFLTTGLFFFISGYGNMLSINKKTHVQFEWLYKKFFKIYTPFIFAYCLYYLTQI